MPIFEEGNSAIPRFALHPASGRKERALSQTFFLGLVLSRLQRSPCRHDEAFYTFRGNVLILGELTYPIDLPQRIGYGESPCRRDHGERFLR